MSAMANDRQRFDSAVSHLSRRQALAAGAALVTAGGSLVVVGEPASAQVSVEGLSVPDKSFTRESVEPVVDVTVSYNYDAGNRPVEQLRFGLTVGGTEVATEDLVTDRTTLSGETQLSGRVTDAEAWSATDFAPAVAEEAQHTLALGLSFAVVDTDGNTVVSDSASTEATVTVAHPQDSEYIAEVGGSGTIRAATPQE
jgi:hypothetical protein